MYKMEILASMDKKEEDSLEKERQGKKKKGGPKKR